MTTLRTAVQQALEALYEETAWFGPTPKGAAAITSLRAALAQQDEPVARECSDPMCACRGGPCAECEEGEREKEIEDLRCSLYFYQRRCEALQSWQSKMRDPERTIVCDILANGKTLDPAFAGDRYTAPPQQAEPVQEPVAWMCSNPELMAKGYERFSSRCEGDWNIPVYLSPPRCPNCASLEAQNTELDRKLSELERAESAQEPVDVALLEYRGNSVAFIHQKMTAYRTGIDAAWDAFEAKGLHPDGKTSLADMIAKYTAPPQRQPLAEWQINDLMAGIDPEDVCSWSFRQGVYAAEKHHGVKP